jgi:hypothetical protein
VSQKPESRLQRRIRGALEAAFLGSYWWKVHGGPFTPAGIPDLAGVVPMSVMTEADDFCASHPRTIGHSVFLEVKMPGECASRVQLARMNRLRSAGAIVGVVTSVDEALDVVRKGLYHALSG